MLKKTHFSVTLYIDAHMFTIVCYYIVKKSKKWLTLFISLKISAAQRSKPVLFRYQFETLSLPDYMFITTRVDN